MRGMKGMIGRSVVLGALATAGSALAASNAELQARLEAMEKELKSATAANVEFQRRQEILTTEIRKVREAIVLPETPKFKSQYGMGPAASKVYGVNRGLSIGGYGQGFYSGLTEDQGAEHSRWDLLRTILYVGYKFSDKLVFNSELEIEHANTADGGEAAMEFAQIDYLHRPEVNFRMGLLLVPVGFINEMHEPLFYHGNQRPETELNVIPTTWRENGLGVFGQIKDRWTYRAYVMASGKASAIRQGNIRGFKQEGVESLADDLAVTARVDYQASRPLQVGGSVWHGETGQRENFTLLDGSLARPNAPVTIAEGHAQYRNRGLEGRVLVVDSHIGDADVLSNAEAAQGRGPIQSDSYGWYGEVAFDLMTLRKGGSDQYLAPFFRWEQFDTQHRVPAGFDRDLTRDIVVRTFGIDYKPHPQVVLKLDTRDFSVRGGTPHADDVNFGFGYIF